MTPDEIRRLDEATTDLVGHLPRMLLSFFTQCKEEGFTESEAFELTKTLLAAMTGKKS